MNQKAKLVYEKMVDSKRFAIVLLAIGIFFYLGVIIPSDAKSEMDLTIMILASLSFLFVSLLCFIQSKMCQSRLMEMDKDEDFFK